MTNILSVIVGWKRPKNIPLVIESIRNQSVESHICLVACNQHEPEFAIDESVIKTVDHLVHIGPPNQGPCARFIPPLSMFSIGYFFTAFFVDDHLAGPKFLETLLDAGDTLKGQWATLGMQGRNVKGDRLSPRSVKTSDPPVPTDCIVTSELIRTADVSHALSFRSQLLQENPSVSTFEDDLILCMGIQKATGYPSYVCPCPDEQASWRVKRLDAPHALSARPDHRSRRDEFVRTALKIGWSSKR